MPHELDEYAGQVETKHYYFALAKAKGVDRKASVLVMAVNAKAAFTTAKKEFKTMGTGHDWLIIDFKRV